LAWLIFHIASQRWRTGRPGGLIVFAFDRTFWVMAIWSRPDVGVTLGFLATIWLVDRSSAAGLDEFVGCAMLGVCLDPGDEVFRSYAVVDRPGLA